MPQALPQPCRQRDCPEVVDSGYCPRHRQIRQATRNDAFYSSRRWRRLRVFFLNHHPLCVDCGGGANEVDHIEPIQAGGALMDMENLRSLCKSCHSKRTAAQVWGNVRQHEAG